MIKKLEVIGSNCMNLLAASPKCDLTQRNLSGCAIPHTYFYKCDLSGSNFNSTNMDICDLKNARLDNCDFV
jgi:uncharacterized protein YjbI with pentapeptide repeats